MNIDKFTFLKVIETNSLDYLSKLNKTGISFCPLYGLAAPDLGWVPAPRYILRRAVILSILNTFNPGRFIEFGSGAGALLFDLVNLGFSGVGVDPSLEALKIAKTLNNDVKGISFSAEPPNDLNEYSYVFAFEVLEHICDDTSELTTWRNYLKENGCLIISVPAHKKLWSNTDSWAGHFRRYERVELEKKLVAAGFDRIEIFSYGWPLAYLILPLRSYLHGRFLKKEQSQKKLTKNKKQFNTARSGIQRFFETPVFKLYSNAFGRLLFRIFISMQYRYYSSEKGTGYIALAKKRR